MPIKYSIIVSTSLSAVPRPQPILQIGEYPLEKFKPRKHEHIPPGKPAPEWAQDDNGNPVLTRDLDYDELLSASIDRVLVDGGLHTLYDNGIAFVAAASHHGMAEVAIGLLQPSDAPPKKPKA